MSLIKKEVVLVNAMGGDHRDAQCTQLFVNPVRFAILNEQKAAKACSLSHREAAGWFKNGDEAGPKKSHLVDSKDKRTRGTSELFN